MQTYLAELERILTIVDLGVSTHQVHRTYKKHAGHKHNQALTITRRLSIARVNLVLDLLERQTLHCE